LVLYSVAGFALGLLVLYDFRAGEREREMPKIRGCVLCAPLLSGDVISRVLRELELS